MRKFIKLLLRTGFRILYRIKEKGKENIPTDRAYLMAPNHIHALDPVILGSFHHEYIAVMAKQELFKHFPVRWFITFMGAFPVDRKGNDIKAIKGGMKILKSGHPLLIFPEGTRNPGRVPLEGKPGVPMIAAKSGVDILPVTIDATYKFFAPIEITYHPPISIESFGFERLNSENYGIISDQLLKTIYKDVHLHGA